MAQYNSEEMLLVILNIISGHGFDLLRILENMQQ